jgi:hypothetical protein
MYPKQSSEGPGWVQTDDDVQRAVAAWRDGTLRSITIGVRDGKCGEITAFVAPK